MSRTGWKQVERDAAACIGATRFWANAGSREDCDSPYFAAQVKNRRALSLAELTLLLEEMTVIGLDRGKVPVVFVKQSARRPTPLMAVVPAWFLQMTWKRFLEPSVAEDSTFVPSVILAYQKESPGLRKRVAAYVERSKRRARGTPERTQRWRSKSEPAGEGAAT